MKGIFEAFLVVAAVSSQGAAEEACQMFEIEVASVDRAGHYHPLFNLGQSVPDGANWKSSMTGKAGELEVSIAWSEGVRGPEPTVSLVLHPLGAGKPAGSARLEVGFWNHLFGPVPFDSKRNAGLVLPRFGRPFAVAAVTKTPCQAE